MLFGKSETLARYFAISDEGRVVNGDFCFYVWVISANLPLPNGYPGYPTGFVGLISYASYDDFGILGFTGMCEYFS